MMATPSCYYWSETMLGYLRRNFPTTTNQELAEWLGVSPSTVIRKARELGLYKDPDWMAKKSSQNGKIGAMVTRLKGNSGQIKKGEHRNPAGEFKPGHKSSPEAKAKIAEAKKRYYRETPARILHERGLKAWETRRRKLQEALAPKSPTPL